MKDPMHTVIGCQRGHTIRFEKINCQLLSSRNVVGTVEGQADDIFVLPRRVVCICWRAFLFLRVQKAVTFCSYFTKPWQRLCTFVEAGLWCEDWGEFIQKDEGVMEWPPLLCVYPLFSLFHFFPPFWNFFVKGAPKLLHVERFVVDDVFLIFRDIYKSVYRKHTTTTAERKKKKTSFVPYLEVVL